MFLKINGKKHDNRGTMIEFQLDFLKEIFRNLTKGN